MSYDYEANNCVVICVVLPPIVLTIGYVVLVLMNIDKGLPTDFWGWLFLVGIFLAIPFGYFISVIFPLFYSFAGYVVQSLVDEEEIHNPIVVLLLCILFDLIATCILYFIFIQL